MTSPLEEDSESLTSDFAHCLTATSSNHEHVKSRSFLGADHDCRQGLEKLISFL